ncbi:hypothetical protein I5907_20805 [Panacibacter sp. DH6]|uniref:Uncharacterized protein n=1 Tax=Panacibacter microcysteis TaxID=2793269 RepID=A0A931H0D2_9BACT|nr:hypothetical protein [Panacibacter microcysteis]MBG9378685.1 hypothetical protein [Panacibacter microcysteis]
MKRFLLVSALLLGSIVYTATASAQVSVRINANIGNQPMWGPAGYDYAQFYYLPDIDMYYDVMARQFVYQNRGQWIYANTLPYNYRNYDLYSGYKVVLNQPGAFAYHDYHRNQFRKYRNFRNRQVVIVNSRDARYAPYKNRRDNRVVVIR